MANTSLSAKILCETLELVEAHDGNVTEAARTAGVPRGTMVHRWRQVQANLDTLTRTRAASFDVGDLPDEVASIDDILQRRRDQYARRHAAMRARALIPVTVREEGPIGIAHLGDPHLDDDGMDIQLLERHLAAIVKTRGLLAGNVGDITNNWVGRLAHLYGQQSTTAAEAWRLAEWLFGAAPWLYVIGGNHDCWSGEGDPLKWIAKFHGTLYEWHGARLELSFPNGRTARINARHDWRGHSMFNPVHGGVRAVHAGWRDHVLVCGDKHTSGYQVLMDPRTGLVSHAIRCATYKIWDSYARKQGFVDQNIFPSCVTIFDPEHPEDSPRFVTTILDVEEGAEYLRWKRQRARVPV